MTPPARYAAAIGVLDRILAGEGADRALVAWGRSARYAGSGDRAAVRDIVFDGIRRKGSAAFAGGALTGRGIVLGLLRQGGIDPATVFTGEGHAPATVTPEDNGPTAPADDATAHDLPDWLWTAFRASWGDDAAPIAEALRHRAPVFLRVNSRKSTREEAIKALAVDGIVALPHLDVKTALEVTENARRIQNDTAYHDGLVELQDAASQRAVLELPLDGVTRILDYCAGAGGKSLALAAASRATIVAHDVAPDRMRDLPERARRADVAIATCATRDLPDQPPFDLVFADAPCSGSGTWRRTPEAKWATGENRLTELLAIQDSVLRDAAHFVGPGGCLAYATCSVLTPENRDRVDAFMASNPDWEVEAEMRLRPDQTGDGFYLAVLRRL